MTVDTKPVATYTVACRGNLAMQTEVFMIPVLVAKQLIKEVLDCTPGTYWETVLKRPTNRAIRHRHAHVRVLVAGFTTGELCNALATAGCGVECRGDA